MEVCLSLFYLQCVIETLIVCICLCFSVSAYRSDLHMRFYVVTRGLLLQTLSVDSYRFIYISVR